MKRVFKLASVPQNLRNQYKCNRSIPCTERYGIETESSKDSKSFERFEVRIKS